MGNIIIMRALSLLIVVFLAINASVECTPLKSLLSLKNIDGLLGIVSPFFKSPEDARAADHLKSIREAISLSAKQNEGWSKLGARLATLAITGKKDLALKEQLVDQKLADGLLQASPDVVKDVVKAKKDGFAVTFLEKFKKVMAKKDQPAENKQAGVDAFVVGMNGLLNFAYASTMAAFTMPTMGLENLFNPDPDYDYGDDEEGEEGDEEGKEDDKEKEDEEKEEDNENEEETENENQNPEATGEQQQNGEANQQQSVNPQSGFLIQQGDQTRNSFRQVAHNHINNEESSYLHYEGQLRDYNNIRRIHHPRPSPPVHPYHRFRMARPHHR